MVFETEKGMRLSSKIECLVLKCIADQSVEKYLFILMILLKEGLITTSKFKDVVSSLNNMVSYIINKTRFIFTL